MKYVSDLMTRPLFSDLKLIPALLQALEQQGYEVPTPIQEQAIPRILERRDLLGCAQTGTGKTAAFALPILQLLSKRPQRATSVRLLSCLVLTPTRELAAQIGESFDRYGSKLGLRNAVIFGGVGQRPQTDALKRGIDILVATPGRLLDLMEQRFVNLSAIEIFVLDEADRMLDMGFVHDVKRVLRALPKKRHSLFFSATMPSDIQRLANDILTNPAKVTVTPVASTAEKIEQKVYFVDQSAKRGLLEHLMMDERISRALVFTRTKHGADKVAKFLNLADVSAEAIHGNKSQNNRIRALNNFKQGLTRVLVATDIAARGIDIDGVTHVINYEIPNVPESYVHRIGRTARAGAEGIAISLCDREERSFLKDIERLIRMTVSVVPGPYPGSDGKPVDTPRSSGDRGSSRGQQSGGRGQYRPQSQRPSQGQSRTQSRPQSQNPSRGSSQPRHAASADTRGSRTPAPYRKSARTSGYVKRSEPVSRSSAAKPVGAEAAGGKAGAKIPWWKKLVSKE